LGAVLDYADIDAGLMDIFEVYQSQALDPNIDWKRSTESLTDYQQDLKLWP